MTTTHLVHSPIDRAPSWKSWRHRCLRYGILPVILVAGSRGKTTVVRMLDAIFTEAGLQTATRTNIGVEIRGHREHGELAPWAAALEELANGSLDIAIEEVDWSTVQALGIDPGSMPIAIVTNVCGNRDSCMIQGEAKRAMQALPSLLAATGPNGLVVLNGEDYAVTPEGGIETPALLFGQARNAPAIRSHLESGGTAIWTNDGDILAGTGLTAEPVGRTTAIPNSLGGKASFQIQNALAAVGAALSCGIAPEVIARGMASFAPTASQLRDTFQTLDIDGVTVVIDRPNPSWFLRHLLRSVRDASRGRIIAVTGRLSSVPDFDVQEVGRLIGRSSSMIVVHSESEDQERAANLKRGVAMNEVPPPIVHTKSERRAVARALNQASPGDVIIVLADLALPLARALSRPSLSPAEAS